MAKSLRLVFPQWQGADIARIVPEVSPDSAAQGYLWGSRILDLLLPRTQDETFVVPVDTAVQRSVSAGVYDADILATQTKDALKLLQISKADQVLTLGGECAVSVAPFTYLKARFKDDVAILWLDAHPDITLPGDPYAGFHAMAVSALLGRGDARIIAKLPATFKSEEILLVGLRDWEREEIYQRQLSWGLKHVSPDTLASNLAPLEAWLKACPCSKVAVHFDVDVLDPADLFCAAGKCPQGLKLIQCMEIIKLAATYKELVGLTIAELMPRTLLRLRDHLTTLPLIGPA